MATDYTVQVGRRRKRVQAETPEQAAIAAVEAVGGSKPSRVVKIGGRRFEVFRSGHGPYVVPLDG